MKLNYRFLNSLEDFKACVELQRTIWCFEDNLDIVPIPLLVIGRKNGGFLYGAFDGSKLVGFVYSIIGMYIGRFIHCSHMLAVLPEYQNQSVGITLKMKQREFALAQGIDLITWTFDPFQVKNAFFNIEKLGAVIRNYYPDLYGETSSRIHYGLPTDRMLSEWYLNSDRVNKLAQNNGIADEVELRDAFRFNVQEDSSSRFTWKKTKILLQMPADFGSLVETNKKEASRLIIKVRSIFLKCFEKQFYVKRFLIRKTAKESKYFYYLQRE